MELGSNNLYIFVLMVIVMMVVLMFNILRMSKMTEKKAELVMGKNPDLVKVFLASRSSLTQEAVSLHDVDGFEPERFIEGTKSGFFLTPGKHTVRVSYSYTSFSVLNKPVTTTTDVVAKEITVDSKSVYIIGFDRDTNSFTFEKC